jgi:NAD(P)-dependent dehydrogenase (short-subunit alcohol dehydrogenase family)
MKADLAGRVAIVTGGGSGIGAGIAQVLAEAGAAVVIADIDASNAEKEAAAIREAGGKADVVRIDLADEASIVRGCAEVVEKHGAPWILVNNAGVQEKQPLLEGTAAEWDRMNAINGRGPFLMSREIARAMIAAGSGGRIVNIGSAAMIGQLVVGLPSYAGSKGAVVGLSLVSALELAEHDITVNVVHPGGVLTPGAVASAASLGGRAFAGPALRPPPLGMCEPRDIAAAVLFFASPAARRVTNQTITVDGGWSIS